ncbi:OmpA family protein [Piscinibacter sp.]|uniref:OmpA family protein n=1 Tax=Piscinibacter sp. TaxID=1903157 RepID=UPI002BF59E4D|nr:OmpA family protein [Albitalea sp.]HUG23462.1 OmpA family protein [Albitalea sp.]
MLIAGAPISNLGAESLSAGRKLVGVASLLACFVCICIALWRMIQLLRADLIYITDIDPRQAIGTRDDSDEIQEIRKDIQLRKPHFFPDFASLTAFFEQAEAAEKSADLLGKDWQDALAANKPVHVAEAAKLAYADQVKEIDKFGSAKQDMLWYAAYLRFYGRVRDAMPGLFVLGIAALVALLTFTLGVQVKKDDKPPPVVVNNPPSECCKLPPAPPTGATDAGTVYFETDKSEIDEAGRTAIENARNLLLAKPDTALLIITRTDTVGSEQHNVSLARYRAEAVRRLMVTPGGIAAARVFSAEMPESDLPHVTGDATDSRLNRSASLYLVSFKRP